ncbi:hypothetical protein SAMD00023353_0902410 [Rosellinia necatrix]|uniref:Uncharacterized protein n=1 Tax=Rosellinia necatrix TaxID=77044 RepID=A0A1W2TLC7_ROSNE|nr:hypothetical protein SAMD00023353_0902410 [Rosellinia necatrix]
MHSNSLIASITALAGVAAAAPAPEHRARAAEPWIASNGTLLFAGHGIPAGSQFDVAAPAGYIPGAPAFSVHCDAYNNYGGPDAAGTACSWRGERPDKYSAVSAFTDYQTLGVTVRHQWLGEGGVRRVSSAAGTLPAPPQYQVILDPFLLAVADAVRDLPGVVGDYGTWSAAGADFVRDSAGRLRGMQYRLSAPAGYAPGAPAFEVACFYDYNPDASVFPECTPVGAGTGGAKVSLWASVASFITIVHHEWTDVDGTAYQLVGTSDALPDLGTVTEFTIKPDILYTL